jgi:hypothetical protein
MKFQKRVKRTNFDIYVFIIGVNKLVLHYEGHNILHRNIIIEPGMSIMIPFVFLYRYSEYSFLNFRDKGQRDKR